MTFRVSHTEPFSALTRACANVVAITGVHLPHLALHMAATDSFLWVHVSARL